MSAARRRGRVLVVGGINADLVVETRVRPGPGETVLGSGYRVGRGGKGANQAVAAALAGARVRMAGAVGADAWGREQLADLSRFGVDIGGVRILANAPTGLAMIAVTPDGENSILVSPGANHALDADSLLLPGAAATASYVTDAASAAISATMVDDDATATPDVVIAQCELQPAVIERTVSFARDIRARLLINAAPVIALSAEAYGAADPLVVNEHEARAVLARYGQLNRRRSGGQSQLRLPAAELAEAVWRATSAGSVVVTLGAQGAAIASKDQTRVVPGEKVTAVDTTGAGDVFVGTLAARLADALFNASAGADILPSPIAEPAKPTMLADAVAEANAAAARCVAWPGTRPPA